MSGPCPFTYTDIEAYCNLKGIYSLGERERLVRFIDLLDREWMANAYEEQKRQEKSNGTSPKSSRTDVPRSNRRPPRKALP